MNATDQILRELRALKDHVAAITTTPVVPDIVLTRAEAARQLKVSVRQLQRLVASGRVVALPSGIARAELERYAKTPQVPLPKTMTRPMRERSASDEADRLNELLKARRVRR